MNYYYALTEKNVDGCGGDATEFARFQTQLQPKQLETLQKCLDHAKETAPEDTDTAGMVRSALDRFEAKTGLFGVMCESPVEVELEF